MAHSSKMSCDYFRSAPIRRVKHPLEESMVWKFLGTMIACIIAIVISLPLLILILLVLPLCTSVRWLLLRLHNYRVSSSDSVDTKRMRGAESRWLGDGCQNSVLHSILVFDTKDGLTVDHFRRLFTARILPVYPRLTRRPVTLPLSAGAGYCWIPDRQFSITRHVLQVQSSLESHEDVQHYVAGLLNSGLPDDKPPWEFLVIPPQGKRKEAVVVVRVHQSIADGTTLFRVLCHSLADSIVIDIPERPQFGCVAFGLNVFRACLTGPFTFLVWLCLTTSDCNPLTRRGTWTGSVTLSWSASITLPKVLRIKQVTRSTVNCVILSALAGALRCLLQGCGVRHPPNVKVLLSLDVRSQVNEKANNTTLGNKNSSVTLPLPVSIEGCVPRLWATRQTLASLRASSDPVLMYMATAALMTVTPATTARYLLDLLSNKASLQFSCLTGPTSPIFVGGERLKQMYCLLPSPAQVGISLTAITYADHVQVSVAAECALGPTAQLLLAYLENQIEMLWTLLINRRVPGEGRLAINFTPEMIDAPVNEIENRLSMMQKEVIRLSEDTKKHEEEELVILRAEFSKLLGELKRRQSMDLRERNEAENKKRRRRAFSCSMTSRQSAISLKNILTTRASSHTLRVTDDSLNDDVSAKKHTIQVAVHEADSGMKKNQTNPLRISPVEVPIPEARLSRNNENVSRSSIVIVEGRENGRRESNTSNTFNQRFRKNSFEIVRDKYKRTEFRPTAWQQQQPVANHYAQLRQHSRERIEKSPDDSIDRLMESEGEDNTFDTETDYSDNTIKISDEETMDLDYDDLKSSGPINKNLRDLYCSNYLDHKLDILRLKETRLNQQINDRSYELYRHIDDIDVEGGVLI